MSQGFGQQPELREADRRAAKILKSSVLKHFQDLPDPRLVGKCGHGLVEIITIALLAVLCGADSFVAIEEYGKAKQEWLERFLELPNGIPSHDTFGRVFGLLNPEELETRFLAWVETVASKLGIELIHIDGKTARGSYERDAQLKALQSVSAWSSEQGMVLAQQRVDSQSNEITAVPLLLNLLDLRGRIVTLDAMGTQREIAAQIKEGGGEYVLALKGNQKKLLAQVKSFFEGIEQHPQLRLELSEEQTIESSHHRLETRHVQAVSITQIPELSQQTQWSGLASVIRVERTRQLWNKTTHEVCFYISSLPGDAARLAQIIRSHWSIENSLHWVLDVTFNEDASRVRQDNAPQNLGLLRRLSVNLLKREPSRKSLAMKRYKAGLDNEFLLKILEASVVNDPL